MTFYGKKLTLSDINSTKNSTSSGKSMGSLGSPGRTSSNRSLTNTTINSN